METTPHRRPERSLLVRLPPSPKEETPLSEVISLEAPRPPPSRSQNLYVEAPLKGGPSKSEFNQSIILSQPVIKRSDPLLIPPHTSKLSDAASSTSSSSLKSSSSSNLFKPRISSSLPNRNPPTPFRPPPLSNNNNNNFDDELEDEEEESIICRECGKCKCIACATPKKLPRKWICSGKLLCSPESAAETLSCYCCVKGAFYHCQKDSEQENWEESPLACRPLGGTCCLRWTALGALSLLMPCLWCYLPLTGCLRLANYVYGRASVTGCTCPDRKRREGQLEEDPRDNPPGRSHPPP